MKDLQIIAYTVGERIFLPNLSVLIERTPPPYNLTVWYDACGRGIDQEFLSAILKFTDDVVVINRNHGTSFVYQVGLLYLGGDYVLFVPADCEVQPGYLAALEAMYLSYPQVACVGCIRVDDHPDYVPPFDVAINKPEFLPDGVQLFSRKAIEDVGGIHPAFKMSGQEQRDWFLRAMEMGWNLLSVVKIAKELGSTHDGRNMNADIKAHNKASEEVFLKLGERGRLSKPWWSTLGLKGDS